MTTPILIVIGISIIDNQLLNMNYFIFSILLRNNLENNNNIHKMEENNNSYFNKWLQKQFK